MIRPYSIRHIDHLVLRVRDVQKMLRFYIDVLGCSMEKAQASIGLWQVRAGSCLVDFVSLDGKLGRMGGAGPGKEGRNLDHLCLSIEPFDLAALRAHLRANEVEPGEYGSRYGAEGDGPSIYLTDPEGNVVELKGPPGPVPADPEA